MQIISPAWASIAYSFQSNRENTNKVYSGSNRASVLKLLARFEITSPITPELYDTKSYCQINCVNNKMRETF